MCPKFGLGNTSINRLLYADDLVLFANSAKNLQLLLNKLSEYAVKNKLSVNTTKSKIMIFGKHHRCHSDDYTIQNTVLDRVNSYKFLGVTFVLSAKWTLHDQEVACKGSKTSLAINSALRNLSASYEISVQQRLLLAKVLLILLYGAELTSLSDTDARSTIFLWHIKSPQSPYCN